ncbi:MAG: DEAD/DEAH box helicase family protein [Candidatus Baltobacteraceae bacterium]
MPKLHVEKTLQREIAEELLARGWIEGKGRKSDGNYDLKRALYAEDVLAWIKATEPSAYAKVQAMHNGDTDRKILDRLVEVIEKHGSIHVLRKGFDYVNAHFSMFATKPNSGLNPSEALRYTQNILRIVQELEYSEHNGNRLDFGFFLNGIPVATGELKTENTQTIDDAVRQYCEDRLPKDPKTKKDEPLLKPKRGAIVHFAISSKQVKMTTALAGAKTVFLPFNQGYNHGAGNPPETGTNYLWEQILARDTWLDILGNFVCVDKRSKFEDGKKVTKETLLFPRYHQWDAVTKLIESARRDGPGNRYLTQHSAGSGKSNTIMWLAHRLANLHDANDSKIFNTVFIVTDRTNLDDQLADTVKQFENTPGLIARIDGIKATKTEQLVAALTAGNPIVSVTLQTFPFVLAALKSGKDLPKAFARNTFAIIADEAHSSQTGANAQEVRKLLALSDDDGDLGLDDAIAAEMANNAIPRNVSYFAFTATPKKRTLEMFGRKGEDGKPIAFHTYTMRQAIEEGFILDVLQNYVTWKMAIKLSTDEGPKEVPKSETAKLIMRMVKLHSYTISQKIAVIVTHFRETVMPELDGHAKAMIVTDSREAAVRYKQQLDRYLDDEKITDVKALVAFSGDVTLKELPDHPFTESNMNDLQGGDIPEAFDTNEYSVLIVAEKYQTGFDQPLLCAMYVDKKLENLTAVQTLSRLNRTYNGPFGKKERVFVLDFVNERDQINDAFLPYYEVAEIDTPTDPNAIYDLKQKIDDYGMPGVFTEADIEQFAVELFNQEWSKQQKQTRLNNLIGPVAQRYVERLTAAKVAADDEAIAAAEIFRKDLSTFVRLFRFLAQIYNFENVALAKREQFYEWLGRGIRERQTGERPDISSVELVKVTLKKTSEGAISLLDGKALIGGGDGGGGRVARIKEYGPLQEVIDLMNEFFGDVATEETRLTMLAGIFEKSAEDQKLAAQAKNNSLEKFTLGSIKDELKRHMTETYVEEVEKHAESTRQMTEMRGMLSEEEKFDQFSRAMAKALYTHFNQQA